MVIASAGNHTELTPWYGEETLDTLKKSRELSGDLELALEVLAVNLLNGELRFKRCDIGSPEHQEESDKLAFIIPSLLQFLSTVSQYSHGLGLNLLQLRCRCYWLASSYHLWISRCSNDTFISKAAEDLGLEFLNKTIQTMELLSASASTAAQLIKPRLTNDKGLSIYTPHLKSSARRGDHWLILSTQTLLKHRDNLQSASIVSKVRRGFQELHGGDDHQKIIASKAKLELLGMELWARYNPNPNVDGKQSTDVFRELLNDFLLLHADQLQLSDPDLQLPSHDWEGEMHWGKLWTIIPSSKAASIISMSKQGPRPSIIQVLASSLIASEEKSPSLVLIFSRLVLTAFLVRAQTLEEGSDGAQQVDFEGNAPVDTADEPKACRFRRNKEMLILHAAVFFIDKMTDTIAHRKMQHVLEAFLKGEEICSIIYSSVNYHQKDVIENLKRQIHLFRSCSRLVLALRTCQELSKQAREKVESVYFVALVRVMILQRKDFASLISSSYDKRLKKWQSLLCMKSELIFSIANEIAELLSLYPSTVNANGKGVIISHLIKAITNQDGGGRVCLQASPLAQFYDSLIWFWKFLHNSFETLSPTEHTVRNRLMVPISAVIIALCGCPGGTVDGVSTKTGEQLEKCNPSFSDFFDSEDSANGLFLSDDREEENQGEQRILLRKLCQLVQCVSLVFQSVNEKLIYQELTSFPSSEHGPFLPLVVVRVLSTMADGIFQLFGESVWEHLYPFGARNCGNTIDNILGKAYVHLYGFSFSATYEVTSKSHSPESIEAATQLFRCIKRVFNDNRKSPPKKAFETVELALPPAKESKASQAVKSFLFNAEKAVDQAKSATDLPLGFPEWVLNDAENPSLSENEDQGKIEQLRRGICQELAKGSHTNLDSKRDVSDTDGLSQEREFTQTYELSLDQKFKAVLECLCYQPNNIEGWIILSECCGFKAEYICDRLVPIQDSYASSDFSLTPKSKQRLPGTMTLDQLQKTQQEEFQVSRQNWIPFLGNNLYLYMKYPWSNFTSLKACADEIRSAISQSGASSKSPNESGYNSDYLSWTKIESKFQEGDYVQWANSWAGLFVVALRKMRQRALSVARYLSKRNTRGGMHPTEVNEDIGTVLYSELMASTVYGYPMHPMTMFEKRRIAECSLSALREAIQLLSASTIKYTQPCHTVTWELQFMVGKCFEKIASTLSKEIYLPHSTEECRSARLYETTMTDAIHNYSEALVGARQAEKSNGRVTDNTQIGGSSHGALECLYRLHASRFKALLNAICRAKAERELAELEAHRIISISWFDKSNQSSSDEVRDKTWDIFADCVDGETQCTDCLFSTLQASLSCLILIVWKTALSHCRRDTPFFHRAAYRLAQAYSWAPAFHDPDCDLTLGSKQAVPAIKSYRIRGLDTGSCAVSAAVVMETLFEKKRYVQLMPFLVPGLFPNTSQSNLLYRIWTIFYNRDQLCAVWLTTSVYPSPFEVINDSLRKYGALRLKYIHAFIDCMCLCGRKDKIETLLNRATSSVQDLPGFYEASASLQGGDPGKHGKHSLITGSRNGFTAQVKRSAISALAAMILSDLAVLKNNDMDKEGRAKLIQCFISAYSLFRRLHTPCREAVEFTRSNEPLIEVQALCRCYVCIQSGYRMSSINFDGMDCDTLCAMLEGAIAKAKTMAQETKETKQKTPQKEGKKKTC